MMHQPVLLHEAIEGLAIQPDGVYIDGTFGRGGHSRAVLEHLNDQGRLIAFDKDLAAVAYAKQHLMNDPRFCIIHASFAAMSERLSALGLKGRVNGILLDLGVSSPQLDEPTRGFSFMQEGPLDMRMNQHQPLTAAGFINQASAEDLAYVFKEYGEERFAKRIAAAIVKAREQALIESTAVLASIVKEANPRWEKHKHPATRVFQALRIYVNQELTDLTTGLQQCVDVLAAGGRLCVISFHSLEDRIVKQFMRDEERGLCPPSDIPVKAIDLKTNFRRLGKAIKPTDDEINRNVRSRSAVLRIGEKIT